MRLLSSALSELAARRASVNGGGSSSGVSVAKSSCTVFFASISHPSATCVRATSMAVVGTCMSSSADRKLSSAARRSLPARSDRPWAMNARAAAADAPSGCACAPEVHAKRMAAVIIEILVRMSKPVL
jgi:hypothetical protein